MSGPGKSEYFAPPYWSWTSSAYVRLIYVNYGLISFVFVDVSLFFWLLNVVCSNLRLWLFFIFVHLRMNKNENLVIELRSMLYKHSTSNFMLLPNRWNGQSLTFSIAIFLDFVVFTVFLIFDRETLGRWRSSWSFGWFWRVCWKYSWAYVGWQRI